MPKSLPLRILTRHEDFCAVIQLSFAIRLHGHLTCRCADSVQWPTTWSPHSTQLIGQDDSDTQNQPEDEQTSQASCVPSRASPETILNITVFVSPCLVMSALRNCCRVSFTNHTNNNSNNPFAQRSVYWLTSHLLRFNVPPSSRMMLPHG